MPKITRYQRLMASRAVAEIVVAARDPDGKIGARPSDKALRRIAKSAARAIAAGFSVLNKRAT